MRSVFDRRGASCCPSAPAQKSPYMNTLLLRTLLMLLPLSIAACRDSSVASYRIPKEIDAASPEATATTQPAAPNRETAEAVVVKSEGADLAWTAPVQWKSNPGSAMRKGSYIITGENAATADLAITAFPGDVGGDLANVNRWRGQLGLEPITAADLPAALTSIEGAGVPISLVDVANGTQRLLAAMVSFNGSTWFFKLTGPDAFVASTKPDFIAFLQTVRVPAANPHASANPPAASSPAPTPAMPARGSLANTEVTKAAGPGLRWSAPAHWHEKPVSAMRKGSYSIDGDGGAIADVSITAFPGDVGGELANVNRWRGQLQLPPLADADLSSAVTHREQNSLHLTLVDFSDSVSANGSRMLGAIVPYDGATWFFKITGPDALVAREKPAFLEFLQTLQTP